MDWRKGADAFAARPARGAPTANHLGGRAGLLAVLALLAAYYLVSYALSGERPHASQAPPAGWWGWADQSEYFKSAWAFSVGQYNWENFHYPPLYALTAAPFFRALPLHPYLAPDLLLFVFFFGVLAAVARRFYGLALPVLVCAAMFAFLPAITIKQWVIPWTSTLAAGLGASLILIYAIADRRESPFALITGSDWLRFAGFPWMPVRKAAPLPWLTS